VRIMRPITLTIQNLTSCEPRGFSFDSGYVHKRFQMKLLITATENEQTLAATESKCKRLIQPLKIAKSTMVPLIPTSANFTKRFG